MEKWELIALIHEQGDEYGGHGGVLSLLEWAHKRSTQEVTESECRAFLEQVNAPAMA